MAKSYKQVEDELLNARVLISKLKAALKIELEVHDEYLGPKYVEGSQRDLHGKLLDE